MNTLYSDNALSRFWQLQPESTPEAWHAAAQTAAGVLPDGASVLAKKGWAGLMEHILGEGQFGPNRYRLSHLTRLYYLCRPLLPRRLMVAARRGYRRRQETAYPLRWPIEDRYVRFLYRALHHVVGKTPPAMPPDSARSDPLSEMRCRSFWPDDARFAFVLTHDVETEAGQAFVRRLADIDERYGFRASFNFVAEDYLVDHSLLAELRERGFEVGIHGLKHNGSLFTSKTVFEDRAKQINHYLREWGAVGFRSPSTHRQPHWMQALEIEYDLSFYDTDPYEAVPGGTMSIWPFFCGRFVELPYTLAQDHTLLIVLRQRTPRIWLDKVDFIARWGGMALMNVHPDYMRDPTHLAVYEEFLRRMSEITKEQKGIEEAETTPTAVSYWHALPREVARWWRVRGESDHPRATRP